MFFPYKFVSLFEYDNICVGSTKSVVIDSRSNETPRVSVQTKTVNW